MRPRFDISDSVGTMRVPRRGGSEIALIAARSPRQRLMGLMGRELQRLPRDAGILFSRCTCIHTFGMRGPISLTWVREEGRGPDRRIDAVSMDASVPPNRVVWGPRGATGVVESHPADRSEELEDERAVTFNLR